MKPFNFVAVIWKCFLLICLPLWTLPTFFANKKRLEKTLKRKKRFYIYGPNEAEARVNAADCVKVVEATRDL